MFNSLKSRVIIVIGLLAVVTCIQAVTVEMMSNQVEKNALDIRDISVYDGARDSQ